MHRHVLVVYPHPDDETFSSAGTIALFTQAGIPVTYVCATRGEMGRNMGRPFFATRETLPHLRDRELRDACGILGIKDLRMLGLRDKTLEFLAPDDLAGRIRTIIDELNPSLVITYHPDFGVHPDHNALGAATIAAAAAMDPERRPAVHVVAVDPRAKAELGPHDLVVDIGSVAEVKRAAVAAHRSQSEPMLAMMDTEPEFRARIQRLFSRESYWVYRF